MKIIAPKSLNVFANPILSSSKSESNRALIIQAISKNEIELNNISSSEDSKILIDALNNLNTVSTINCNHAGTTFRFLTAYLSTLNGQWILDGSERLQKRPISYLVDALNKLGANIIYLEKNGFAPIKVQGTNLNNDFVEIDGNISSQFISALLLIAPSLKNGLNIKINGPIFSKSYINLTLKLMKEFGIQYKCSNNLIEIHPQEYLSRKYIIENDWSAASYWFSMAALSKESKICIKGLKKNSFQGDAILMEYYKDFGVHSHFNNSELIIEKKNNAVKKQIKIDLKDNPDIAQTIAVTSVGLGIECHLKGLDTLKLKESNRLEALRIEFEKLGIKTEVDHESIIIEGNQTLKFQHEIATYNDHRMAMAFAPLSLRTKHLKIKNPEVVKKSYPEFWMDLSEAGFAIEE